MKDLETKVRLALPKAAGIDYAGPSMLTNEEKAFYFLLGSTLLSLDGVVVDAGCWLGSSAFYLARGVEENNRLTDRFIIHACDIFRWDKNHNLQGRKKGISLQENEDFQFLTKRFLKPVKVRIETKKIDYSVPPNVVPYHKDGTPIEALLVDAGKTPELLINILIGYIPYCIDGKTIIFFQDFRDYFCWFIPPIVSFLGDAIEPVIYLKNGGAAFVVRRRKAIEEKLEQARVMIGDASNLEKYYDKALKEIGAANTWAYHTVEANKVAMFLHLSKTTEVYFGPSEEIVQRVDLDCEESLMRHLDAVDATWPIGIPDRPVQNAFRRIRHAVTGKKDLKLNYRSSHYYKRRFLNLVYLKIFLKRLFRA